jgi:hypothetical protein
MTGEQCRKTVEELGLSVYASAPALETNLRTAQRYASGVCRDPALHREAAACAGRVGARRCLSRNLAR